MNLCYLLIALPLFLCAENYIVENEKHQTLFFISTATQTDKTADFLSMTFPESNRRMQSFPRRNVISPAELSSLKGDKKLTVTLGPALSVILYIIHGSRSSIVQLWKLQNHETKN